MGQAGSKGPAVSKDPQAEPAPAVSTEVVSIDEVSPNDIVIVWVSNISILLRAQLTIAFVLRRH